VFTTTSSDAGYTAFVTWDDTFVYIGYEGSDVALNDPTRVLFAYFDTSPGDAAVETLGEVPDGGTEAPAFPPRFNAQYEWRWYASNVGEDFRAQVDGGWASVTDKARQTFQNGTFVETRISRSALGNPTQLGIATFMMNTTAEHEGTYAGLFAGSFADGYYTEVPVTFYEHADFSSPSAPNSEDNRWAYQHSVALPYDGGNNFDPGTESFATTTSGYTAYISWDNENLYIGYTGDDISANDQYKWVFAYVDVDPGANTGSNFSEVYGEPANYIQCQFPSGFEADYYWRWRTDNQFEALKSWNPAVGGWESIGNSQHTWQSGTYVETQIPLSALNLYPETLLSSTIHVITFMVNEASDLPGTYAGLFSGNFTDGPPPNDIQVTEYLQINLDGRLVPNAPSNKQ
jgi:hypothetical protein